MNLTLSFLRHHRFQRVAILGSIPLLVSTHWFYARTEKQLHNLLYHLDVIPVLLAAMLFGWRTSIAATALTLAAEVPQLWTLWWDDRTYRLDQVGETIVTGIAGLVVGVLSDHSRRQRAKLEEQSKQLEAMNTALQTNVERLKKAERMYAVGQMAANLAHELRTPLSGIAGAAGILKRGNASSENIDECCEIIDLESQRLNKLLADFLAFARPRVPRLQATDVASVMDSVIALARHSGRTNNVRFRREVSDTLPEVYCDSEQIKQVLLNLVMNAIDAGGGRGTISLCASEQAEAVLLSVEDEGSGVPPEQADRIFEPFFTTKESGNGLGLAIASQIADQHGGTLTAENVPDGGFRMTLRLPLTAKMRASA